ncbi:uncharacterized protein LOC106378924 [Brassica napus]|uniref:uncharacterized protein LOC106378924 n=1 Tax=Brassica napus TaxID=3708 RepID=UPI0020789271|nr:uncharacterized protein LOC106378924 [Brassica napus]
MADLLQKAIQSMSLEEEEPLTLPDSPRFRVFDENETSLLGRLLNPDCQSMERMIEYIPTAWRVYGRVRGIALSRDRFQFVFQREEDLVTVLKDRPWSYNHWTMVLERWTANPPASFLQSMLIWIRMRHIPVNFFTVETMHKLASEVGKVVEVAYDPKVSHTKDYIRALVLFDTNNPAKASRKLTIKGGTVTIEFDYERIHKRCFHCLRLTHEKAKCPFLKKGLNRVQSVVEVPRVEHRGPVLTEPLSGPPGFPLMFPELSGEDRKMAMLYISHADPTERLARIERVKQGIAENTAASSIAAPRSHNDDNSGEGTESSGSLFPACSAPIAPSGFQLGPSSEGRVIGSTGAHKSQRRRPQAWKRRATGKDLKLPAPLSIPSESGPISSSKRKAASPLPATENKNKKLSESTVASVLKPLPPQ